MLEYLAERAAHGDPHFAKVFRVAFVDEGFGSHPAHTGHWTTHHAKDVGNGDLVGVVRQFEAAFGTALTRDQPTASKVREDCAEELGWQFLFEGEMLRAHRHVTRREGEERANRVVGLGGDLHRSILPHALNARGEVDRDF